MTLKSPSCKPPFHRKKLQESATPLPARNTLTARIFRRFATIGILTRGGSRLLKRFPPFESLRPWSQDEHPSRPIHSERVRPLPLSPFQSHLPQQKLCGDGPAIPLRQNARSIPSRRQTPHTPPQHQGVRLFRLYADC